MAPLLSRSTAGGLAAALLAATFALAFVDLVVVSKVSSSSYDHPDNVTAERVVSIRSVEAHAGDVVRIQPDLDLPRPFAGTDFYIVESGEGTAFHTGQRPAHVYAERLGMARGASSPAVFVERPSPPASSTFPDRLDMVWVVHFEPGTEIPTDPEARMHFDRWLRGADLSNTPVVTDDDAVAFAKFASWPLYVLAVAALVALVLWTFAPRTDADDAASAAAAGPSGPSEAAESGLALVATGERYLRMLRNLLLGALPILAYAAWASLFFFWGETAWLPGAGAGWEAPVRFAVAASLLGTGAAWAVLTWRVHQALRRWTAWQRQNPLVA